MRGVTTGISYAGLSLAGVTDHIANATGAAGIPAASIAAALGASLVRMGDTAGNRTRALSGVPVAGGSLPALIERLLTLADADRVAYGTVMAAYGLPKATEGNRTARDAAIQAAMEQATDTPLEVMRTCDEVLREAAAIAPQVPARARPDFAIGVELVDLARRACGLGVESNATELTDESVVQRVTRTRERIDEAAAASLERIRAALASRQ
jgi:formiminotetrahydrofolate cyclodeaminase